jgi:GT2 family glycosyltransferase
VTPDSRPDLSISIVDMDNREQTLDCLRSVFSQGGPDLEVFVVDNACTDGSAEAIAAEFPRVRLLRNERRLGFSTNNNRALSQARGRYLMLLNDDTLVHTGALEAMVRFADAHPAAGAVGAALLNPDGSPQLSYDRAPGPLYEAFQPMSRRLAPSPRSRGEPLEVASVSGACLLVRSEAAAQVGLLDTDFDPLYSEEVEWCHRIRQAGWKVVHLPQAQVTHLGSQTMNRAPLSRLDWLYGHKALFYRKHGTLAALWTFKAGLLISSLLKLAFWSAAYPLRRDRARVAAHWHVARRCLWL